jgi:hypothetical protein
MLDNLTKFLAAWGALLSTFGMGWSLYRDLLDRPRLKLTAHMRRFVQAADGKWYTVAPSLPVEGASARLFLVMDVINVGRRPIRWTGWGGKYYKRVGKSDSFACVPIGLPRMLNEGESHTEFSTDISLELLDNIKSLFIWDGSGKNWYAGRRQVKKLKEDYKKHMPEARAKPSSDSV